MGFTRFLGLYGVYRDYSIGFRVLGVAGIQSIRFRVYGLMFRAEGIMRMWDVGFKVQGVCSGYK